MIAIAREPVDQLDWTSLLHAYPPGGCDTPRNPSPLAKESGGLMIDHPFGFPNGYFGLIYSGRKPYSKMPNIEKKAPDSVQVLEKQFEITGKSLNLELNSFGWNDKYP